MYWILSKAFFFNFLHLLRWSCGFYLWIWQYSVRHWLICVYWRIFASWDKFHFIQCMILLMFSWILFAIILLRTSFSMNFSHSSAGNESACNARDLSSIPRLGRSPGEGNGYPFQYSGLENSMDCVVHGVAKSWAWLSDFHFQ